MFGGNVAVDGYGLNREELSNVPTNGYGSGTVVLLGGSVVDAAEKLLVDFTILEDLVADVEDALAPVVETLITEIEAEISLSDRLVTEIRSRSTERLSVAAAETELALDPSDSERTSVSPTETETTALDTGETGTVDLRPSDGPATSIEPDERLSGEET